MPRSVLVDSCVFIGLLRDRLDPIAVLGHALRDRRLITCGMVRLEVIRGLRGAKMRSKMEAAFDLMPNVPTDNRLWEQATEIACILDRRGRPIPAPDILVAACALRGEAAVLTFDRRFWEMPGLTVIGSLDDL